MKHRAALFALAAFALVFQGSRGLWDPDEGRYVNVALRMIESGDWWTPHLHHELPHFSKPPLTYWAIAGSMSLFGRNEWAVRLPVAAAWFGTVLLVFLVARRLAPGREALAAVIQTTALLPFAAMNIVTTDTLLVFFESLGVYGFVRSHWAPIDRRGGLLWMWTGFGLAFFTKGPPGLLPLAAIVAFVISTAGFSGLRRLWSLAGATIFLLIAFGWYAAQIAARPDLLSYLLGQEVVGRLTSKALRRNSGLAGMARAYLGVALAGMLPWAPWAVVRWISALRRPADGEMPPTPERRFLRWWLLLPLAVFLASSSRLPLYLLALVPPATILLARALPADALASRRLRALLALWLALLVSVKGFAAIYPTPRDGRKLAAALKESLPYPPLELVVVKRKPSYSLAFYLDTEVEQVDLAGLDRSLVESDYRPRAEPLNWELSEREPGTIYLVPKEDNSAFVNELRASGYSGRKIGEVEDFEIFATPKPLSDH